MKTGKEIVRSPVMRAGAIVDFVLVKNKWLLIGSYNIEHIVSQSQFCL